MQRLFASLLIALVCATTAYAQRMYDGSGRQTGRSQVVRTEVWAPSSQDARWLLWAQF